MLKIQFYWKNFGKSVVLMHVFSKEHVIECKSHGIYGITINNVFIGVMR
jgi:hypothetical protein